MLQASVQPDVVSCSCLIRAAAPEARGHWLETLRARRAALDIWAYAAVIDACAQVGDSRAAARWHCRAEEERLHPNVVTYNSVINACARRGDSDAAERWLMQMMHERIEPKLITFNSVLKACRQRSDVVSRTFQSMASWSIQPDLISFNSAIAACVHSDSAAPEIARWIGELRSQQLAPDGVTFTTVMQAAHGSTEQAEAWFDWLESASGQPNCHAYASIIAMCQQGGEEERAEKWMQRCLADGNIGNAKDLRAPLLQMLRGANAVRWLGIMKSRSIDPGIKGYTSVIASCARKGDAAGAKRHFAAMEAAGYKADLKGLGALIRALSCSGEAKEALNILEVAQEQSLADGQMYHQVLVALAASSDLDKVPELFRRMVADGIALGPAAFSSLRTALGSEESQRICDELGVGQNVALSMVHPRL